MSQYNDNVQHHTTTANNQEDHESHPNIIHKIADKLGISHKKDDHKDGKDDKHSEKHGDKHSDKHVDPSNQASHLHDNDPHHHRAEYTQQGAVHKTSDKVSDHSDHKGQKHHADMHGTSSTAPAQQVGVGAFPVYPPELHENNLDNQAQHDSKESPGFKEKLKSKLGMGSDDKKVTDHHKKTEEANLFGTPPSHSRGHQDLGGVSSGRADHTTGQEHTSNKDDSPGFKEKIKSKLGLSNDHQSKTEGANLFGLPPSNPDNQSGHQTGDIHGAGRGFGAAEPLTHVQQGEESSSILPKSTPQAEAGSIYSSSLLDGNHGSAVPDGNTRQGHTNTATRGTSNTSGSHQL